MTQPVDIKEYRHKVVEEKAFGPWRKRFGESYDVGTRVSGLSDNTLYFLARPGEEAAFAFYELIMGILDLGQAPKFYYLDDEDQLKVVDIHLFLADQLRLELMRRLGWVSAFPSESYSIFEMVETFETIRDEMSLKPAILSESYREYDTYESLSSGDKQMFLRRRLMKALEAFRALLKP
jgi:hypothetical protein